ncbi:MAG TPA: LytTR family DNA-binding domain-containing protein [Steroidobacteraceae bacterium]|nr:LytTR family DNA-binding domain-containing protein [Steroidobacteraceae bacterium]
MTANGTHRLRVFVVDGDEGARQRLRALLESVEPLDAFDDAASVPQAAGKIEALRPDVVLLDIDLPGAAELEALRAAHAPCLVAMTARPERALPAFELEAIDYLVKPVQRERLVTSLARARRRIAERRIAELALEIAGAAAAIHGPAPVPASLQSRFPDQMTIRVRRRMFALPVEDISWIEGASQYSRVHAKGGEYLLSRSLASLECELDPARFFRIHRSAIVNAAYVREVMSRGDGRYNVYLRGGEALPLGRARRDTLYRLLGGIHAKKSGGPKAAASL